MPPIVAVFHQMMRGIPQARRNHCLLIPRPDLRFALRCDHAIERRQHQVVPNGHALVPFGDGPVDDAHEIEALDEPPQGGEFAAKPNISCAMSNQIVGTTPESLLTCRQGS